MKVSRGFLIISFVVVNVMTLTGRTQPLDSLLQKAVDNHPQLNALYLEYQAEMSRVDQVGQLPNPTLGSGIPALRPETRLGPQLVMISATQMFPWFGTLNAKEAVVLSMSKVKYEKIAALKLDLFFQIKRAYFMIDFHEQRRKLIKSNIKIFQTLENIALANVQSGQALTSDVLRIQLKVQELESALLTIDQEREIFDAQINELTNQAWDNSTRITDSLSKYENLLFDTTAYNQKIREYHPIIAQLQHKQEVSKNMKVVNKKMNAPMIGLGLDYSVVGERTDASPLDNGRDILIPKIRLTIPIYRKSYQAKNQEEDFKIEALESKKQAFINKAISQLLMYKAEFEKAKIELELHKDQIKTTKRAIEILLVNYSSTGKGIDDLLQMENHLLMHEIGVVKAKLQLRLAKAKIERLTDF